MTGLILWMGPVSASNLKSVKLPANWSIYTVAQEQVAPSTSGPVALTPSQFNSYAVSLGADPLSALIQKSGTGADQVILASFSAGAGLLEPILERNAGDSRIVGVYSADSYYGLAVKPGYLAQAKASIAPTSRVPFWLSTSNTKGGVTTHSGSESVLPFANKLGLVDVGAPSSMPSPVTCRGLGNVLWLDYQGLFTHVEHATKLCPAALNDWLGNPSRTGPLPLPKPGQPGSCPSGPCGVPGPSSIAGAMVMFAGIAVAYIGTKYVLKKYHARGV